MADTAADQTYRGTITGNNTVTVTGRGDCIVKVVGNTWDSGVLSLLDNLCNAAEYKAIDKDGTAQTVSTGNQTWYLEYNEADQVSLRLSMASVVTASDVDVYVSFAKPPPV